MVHINITFVGITEKHVGEGKVGRYIKLKYRQVVKYTTNLIRCKGSVIDYMFWPFFYKAIIRSSMV